VYFHIYLTDSCNLACSYCRGKIFSTPDLERDTISIESDIPVEISCSIPDLCSFLSRDPEPVITFIGGEPTLNCDAIIRIMEALPEERFMIQTNGLLLHRLPSAITNRFETILISIDGDEQTTDRGRGEGTYRRIMENISHILAGGYSGEIIGRMTVHEGVDILQAVTHLADNRFYSFSSIHWQMDANFWNDYHFRNFPAWAQNSYIPGIRTLVGIWIDRMEKTGIVDRWYPFIDPVQDMLLGKVSRLRCGSGYANYTILTNGQIVPCPVMVGMKDYYAGEIVSADPCSLPVFEVPGLCLECDIRDFCGGRCLYSAVMEPWPQKGRQEVCMTVKVLYETLRQELPSIRGLLEKGIISIEDFAHEKYNGCEIIP
jgi:putative peptide-modifying radical SAM enzyme